ncbi:MAG: FGGY family carbohydrate kinase, partial [Naasia sp.]
MTDAHRVTLGVDIGTTGTKAVLLDPERGIIARVARPSTLRSERPGWAEADPREWYDGVIDSIREI